MIEKSLLTKAKKGDKEALIKLVMEKKDEYYRLAFLYLGNKDEALDAFQDMVIILYDNIGKLKKDDAFYSWSKTILVNSCKKVLKNRKKITYLEDTQKVEGVREAVQTINDLQEIRLDLNNYLEQLSFSQQEAIKLKYFLDLDYETISKVTNSPIGTVKSRVFNGLKRLKEMLGGAYNE